MVKAEDFEYSHDYSEAVAYNADRTERVRVVYDNDYPFENVLAGFEEGPDGAQYCPLDRSGSYRLGSAFWDALEEFPDDLDLDDLVYQVENYGGGNVADAVLKRLERNGREYVLVGATYGIHRSAYPGEHSGDPMNAVGVLYCGPGDDRREFLESILGEIRDYCEGEVYGIIHEREVRGSHLDADEESDWDEIDSCWGFIGEKYAKEEAASWL